MATGLTIATTSNLTTGSRIMLAAAKTAYEPAAPDPDLWDNVRMPSGHKQWDTTRYERLAAATALTEGTDLAQPEQLVTTTVTITPAEKGVLAIISKRLIRRQADDVYAKTGELLANSLRRREALDTISLYDTFTKTIVGAASPLDVTYFRGAVAYLLTDNSASYGPAPMPLFASLHIEQISDIVLDLTDITGTSAGRAPLSGGLSEEMIQRWWRGSDRLYGVAIWHGGNISRDASGDSKGALGNKGAITRVEANEAEPTEEDDKSLRAIELGIFKEFEESLVVDPHGVEVFSDTAATV